jgi:hypothetical protein
MQRICNFGENNSEEERRSAQLKASGQKPVSYLYGVPKLGAIVNIPIATNADTIANLDYESAVGYAF